jgi:thiol:disulfide interchange protein DsbD
MSNPARLTPLLLLLGMGCTLPTAALAADADSIAALKAAPASQDEFLQVDEAFKVGATASAPDKIEVIFEVHKGYYLYRGRMKYEAAEGQSAELGAVQLPAGETKEDEFFGKQEVYHHDVTAVLPVARAVKDPFTFNIKVTYQGCAEAGLCYPPQTKSFAVAMPAAEAVTLSSGAAGKASGGGGYVSEQDKLAGLIRNGNIALMLALFFGAGLLLAFTPCVLPMVPIVVGLITAGGANVTRARGFSLSLAYVLGMAATYTAAGVAVAAAGQQAQTLFQLPWIIALFSALFVAMAIAMFGFFTVQMPSAVQTLLSNLSNKQRAGSYVGVVVMGALSALIVTTCVGPALVAALSVIGQSGQIVRGGFALFAMAIGMGTPLLVVGASAGQLLPKAGAWMDTVKQLVGAMMLGVAVWMIGRILPDYVTAMLWSIPLVAAAIVLFRAPARSAGGKILAKALGAAVGIFGALILIGGVRVASSGAAVSAEVRVDLPFQRFKSLADLNAKVAEANAAGKTVMVDFYADWCVSCKEMEHYTFPQQPVRDALANTVWLQADVTANDAIDQELMKHFGIVGPPTIAFYGTDGKERRQYRVVGYMKAEQFAPLVTQALAPQ